MSTRSWIGIEDTDGSVRTIYCHHDGYIEGVGQTLKEHYTDREKVEALIELGDVSSLGDDIESTIAYHRDRGEDLDPAIRWNSCYDLKKAFDKDVFIEYCYVLRHNEKNDTDYWSVASMYFEPLDGFIG